MRCPHKRRESGPSVGAAMFVLNLVCLALLAASSGQSDIQVFTGVPRYVPGQWILSDESLQYDEGDVKLRPVEENLWPDIPAGVAGNMLVEDQTLLTTPEVAVEEQGEKESLVWKIVLVVAILLMSIVGCLSTAYYLCVWRGGRIHYMPQKHLYA